VAEEQKKARDPGFAVLTKIPSATKEAMLDELVSLGVFSKKTANIIGDKVVTEEEAMKALGKLRGLEKSKETPGQIGRAALVGGMVMPAASLAWRAIAGAKGRAGGKLLVPGNVSGGYGLWPGTRHMLATAGQGAVLGGGMSPLRHKLEEGVEEHKLREFLGQDQGKSKVRKAIKGTIGV
jgi:hypothetical protein